MNRRKINFQSPLRQKKPVEPKSQHVDHVCQQIPTEPQKSITRRGLNFNSPLRQKQPREAVTYKCVTQTIAGNQVSTPTQQSVFRLKPREVPYPIKQKTVCLWIPINKKLKFDDALGVYENNQTYISKHIEDSDIFDKLKALEKWFCSIAEPKPRNVDEQPGWRERESFKKIQGYSRYCDPDLIKYF